MVEVVTKLWLLGARIKANVDSLRMAFLEESVPQSDQSAMDEAPDSSLSSEGGTHSN